MTEDHKVRCSIHLLGAFFFSLHGYLFPVGGPKPHGGIFPTRGYLVIVCSINIYICCSFLLLLCESDMGYDVSEA